MHSVKFNREEQTANSADALIEASKLSAREAGLHYSSDQKPGIRRKRHGKTFSYSDATHPKIKDTAVLRRIRSLVIPPAWTEVWICPIAHGHIQATGRDARGRKQYRYHHRWRATRDSAKFDRLLAFGEALPRIRRHVARDLKRPGLGWEKALSTLIRLLETTLIRVGNEEYLRQNRSVGLSTMRDRHVTIQRDRLRFSFRGKGGIQHQIDLRHPQLARIVRRMQELPGQELFHYLDDNDTPTTISSTDINAYLRQIAGDEFSAKDFRTWAGTTLAAQQLSALQPASTQRQARLNIVAAVKAVAKTLGNTPAICRRCYIHPVIIERYIAGETVALKIKKNGSTSASPQQPLSDDEKAVLSFLRTQLKKAKRGSKQR